MLHPEIVGAYPMTDNNDLSRRDFAKLTLSALAGLSAGMGPAAAALAQGNRRRVVNPLLTDPHICRGLNTCKGKGVDRRNKCAGTGACATASYHVCKGHNDCRGQGGCGSEPGENQCRGWGACDVPLRPNVWVLARKRYEQLMVQGKRTFGVPPLVANNQYSAPGQYGVSGQ
jgi:hypothetical protein